MPPEAAELAAMEFNKVGILLEGAGARECGWGSVEGRGW